MGRQAWHAPAAHVHDGVGFGSHSSIIIIDVVAHVADPIDHTRTRIRIADRLETPDDYICTPVSPDRESLSRVAPDSSSSIHDIITCTCISYILIIAPYKSARARNEQVFT